MPKGHLTYIVTAYGKPRSKYGLGNNFAKWATAAGLPKCCRLHGLKKGGLRRGAEAGMTTHELMAISNDADRKSLAESAMAKLRGQNRTPMLQTSSPRDTLPPCTNTALTF